MEKKELLVGDLMQINPEKERYGGCFLVVTEPKAFGAQGYLISPFNLDATRYKGVAYLRVNFSDMEYIGHIIWGLKEEFQEDENA
jgi:hypothetical protein